MRSLSPALGTEAETPCRLRHPTTWPSVGESTCSTGDKVVANERVSNDHVMDPQLVTAWLWACLAIKAEQVLLS